MYFRLCTNNQSQNAQYQNVWLFNKTLSLIVPVITTSCIPSYTAGRIGIIRFIIIIIIHILHRPWFVIIIIVYNYCTALLRFADQRCIAEGTAAALAFLHRRGVVHR